MLFTLNLSFVIAYLIVFVQSRNLDVFASRTSIAWRTAFWLADW